MPVLQIDNLSKSYGKIKALQNLSLTIDKGEVFGILGPNGSGKTTTLGIILGILKASSGSFKWFDGEYGAHYRLKIGSILETPNFFPYLDADDNLEIVRQIKKIDDKNFDDLLEEIVELDDVLVGGVVVVDVECHVEKSVDQLVSAVLHHHFHV